MLHYLCCNNRRNVTLTKRIGFACKYLHPDQTQPAKLLEELQRPLNEKATTITWLDNQQRGVAEQRLSDIIDHNTQALEKLIRYVGSLPPELRMVRIGSGQLPAYTHSNWNYFYNRIHYFFKPCVALYIINIIIFIELTS